MNSENEFREILGDKLNGKQFNFDSGSWEQARDLIDATREKKRKRPFIWLFFGLLGILLGTGIIFMLPGKEKELAQHASNESRVNQSVQKNTANVQPENNSDDLLQREKSEDAKKVQPAEAERKTEQIKNAEVKSRAEDPGNSDNKIQASAKKESKTERETVAAIPAKTKKAVSEKKEYVKAGVAITVKPGRKKKKEENAGIATGRKKQESEEGTGVSGIEKGKENSESIGNIAGAGIQSDTNKTHVMQEPVVNAGVKTLSKPESEDSKQDASPKEVKEPVIIAKADSAKAVTKIDSSSVSNALPPKPKDPYHIFSAELGALYLYGWQNPGVCDANGYNPYIGLNFSTHIHTKFWIRTGIGYYSVRNLSYSEKTSKITRLGLGEESAVTIITPSTLHYSTFTIKLSYDIDKNNSIAFGYYYSYLFDVAVKKETYQYHSGAVSDNAVSKDHGYMQGFRRADNLLSVCYRRRIWKQLSANAEFMFGLNDVKDNAFFNSSVYERNFGFKCSLIYDIIRK
jgi:hypothetical protein